MTAFPSHHQRRGLFDKPTVFTLTNTTLDIAVEGKSTRSLPLASISSIRLQHESSRKRPDFYRCIVSTRGHGRFIIQNRTDIPFGTKAVSHGSYLILVLALHDRLKVYGDKIRYRAGSHPIGLVWNFAMIILAAALCIYILTQSGKSGFAQRLFFPAIVIAISLPVAAFFAFRGRPRSYLPSKLPSELLPKSAYYNP